MPEERHHPHAASDDGTPAVREHDVTAADTAAALGSGDVDVLATPRLLAWCEAATCAALAPSLRPDQTSVGSRVRLDHLLATPVGGRVTVTATVVHVDGRLRRLEVVAHDREQRLVATGEVTRVVVDRDRFSARVPAP
ncbi:thioesterase family protein [Thalassiella azotivora]